MELTAALHRDLAVVKLLDVPRVHGNSFQLHLMAFFQSDDATTSLDIQAFQQRADRTSSFKGLSGHQRFGIAGTQDVRGRRLW